MIDQDYSQIEVPVSLNSERYQRALSWGSSPDECYLCDQIPLRAICIWIGKTKNEIDRGVFLMQAMDYPVRALDSSWGRFVIAACEDHMPNLRNLKEGFKRDGTISSASFDRSKE
jgi:hypothetical protein